ncbi:unnamed protein product [Ostreobium quekettii]|uniref:ethanolamine-phosphate cytidylyltransferase n=1 Tax=Ostreobium quekettii TaxID=121088 RepID=A0A8S1ISX9_9CHLO|nr:unnamed protein product [Ostreobium quekettii]|eukprot:evm.model.scf_728EXC.2 EVM.evm.TU.scf_728EXC.2   scf_728EXC:15669-19917(-)
MADPVASDLLRCGLGAATTSGRDPDSWSDWLWWPMLMVSAPLAATAAFWVSRLTYKHFVPYQYQYRPGTISGWVAKMLQRHASRRRKVQPIRVYLDGCFDMMHYGHANALRQAKVLGDELVVGLIPDSEVERCKGSKPVLCDEERLLLVDAVKWVDEVLTGVPYELSPEFTQELFTKHRIDYIVHGDDPCLLPDGTDAYAYAKKLGRFRMIKRTEGVSTTDIVGRMLTCTRVNKFVQVDPARNEIARKFSEGGELEVLASEGNGDAARKPQKTAVSHFMPTSRRIVQFSEGRVAKPNAKIVYIDGAFDVFHAGHVAILKEAKALGDFLLVGLHGDECIMERRGPHMPIMNLHERSLSVLACKFVDEVIIGVPPNITEDLIRTFNISLVVRGTLSETSHLGPEEAGRYDVAIGKGIYREIESPNATTTGSIIRRIVENNKMYEARNAKKSAGENSYYKDKKFIQEL